MSQSFIIFTSAEPFLNYNFAEKGRVLLDISLPSRKMKVNGLIQWELGTSTRVIFSHSGVLVTVAPSCKAAYRSSILVCALGWAP